MKKITISLDPEAFKLVEAAATLSGKSIEAYTSDSVSTQAQGDRDRFKATRTANAQQRR